MVRAPWKMLLTAMGSIRRRGRPQPAALLAFLLWLVCAPMALAEPAVGDWSGVLRPTGGFLRLNLHIVEGCKHLVPWDAADEFVRLAVPFLKS